MELESSNYGVGTFNIVLTISCVILALSLIDTSLSVLMMESGQFYEASFISAMFVNQFGYLGFLVQDATIFLFYIIVMMALSFVNPYISIAFGGVGILINLWPVIHNINLMRGVLF